MRDYELIRSRRKTLALELTRDGRLIARAPMRLAKREIDRIVAVVVIVTVILAYKYTQPIQYKR